MKTTLSLYDLGRLQFHSTNESTTPERSQLVLGFGEKEILQDKDLYQRIKQEYPVADIVFCSTAGQIFNNNVYDHVVSIAAIEFERSRIKTVSVSSHDYPDSYEAGKALVTQIDFTNLAYILLLSDGSLVNGSELVSGVNNIVANRVPVTGGLAGDGTDFQSTLVGLNSQPEPGLIVAIAFYGKNIIVSHGSMGGWEFFGPERTVTRSQANQLFEIEGQNALDFYKTYLGSYADQLPGSSLLFPLSVKSAERDEPVVRTILSINQADGNMLFAGDIPTGSRVRFMKANFDKLIDAASHAATGAFNNMLPSSPRLALLISCVGRKIILGKRTEEEVEAVAEAFGPGTKLIGFYSYGEISPFSRNTKCELHNQTMTITAFDEI